MIIALMAAALVLVPFDGADGAYHSIDGEKSILAVDGDADYIMMYSDTEHESIDISYSAKLVNTKGETMTSAVAPSTGTVDNGVSVILTVTAPSDAGRYTLEVTYTGTYYNGETDVEIDPVTDRFEIKVVEPISLVVNVSMEDSSVDLSGYGVYFWVDGEKMADSYTTFSVSSSGSGRAAYDWVADPSSGEHVFWVESANGGVVDVVGLDEKHKFYVGDNDYSLIIAFSVILLILVIIVLIWIYRKPVKNFGKPKARRKRGY